MGVIRISRLYRLEMAHKLTGHDGACKNVHGHSYQLKLELIGSPLSSLNHPKDGMLIDFADLDDLVKTSIILDFDHSLLLNENDELLQNGNKLLHEKIIELPFQPTCENLVQEFAKRISGILPKQCKLNALHLQETFHSGAAWHAEDN